MRLQIGVYYNGLNTQTTRNTHAKKKKGQKDCGEKGHAKTAFFNLKKTTSFSSSSFKQSVTITMTHYSTVQIRVFRTPKIKCTRPHVSTALTIQCNRTSLSQFGFFPLHHIIFLKNAGVVLSAEWCVRVPRWKRQFQSIATTSALYAQEAHGRPGLHTLRTNHESSCRLSSHRINLWLTDSSYVARIAYLFIIIIFRRSTLELCLFKFKDLLLQCTVMLHIESIAPTAQIKSATSLLLDHLT